MIVCFYAGVAASLMLAGGKLMRPRAKKDFNLSSNVAAEMYGSVKQTLSEKSLDHLSLFRTTSAAHTTVQRNFDILHFNCIGQ